MSNIEKFEIPDGSIDVKRFYLPVEFSVPCPRCGSVLCDDFEEQYLSYPNINSPEDRSFYCDYCDKHFTYQVKVQLTVEADLNTLKEEDY